MNQVEPIDPIVERCRWLADANDLLSLVPEFSGVVPPIEAWPIDDGLPHWVTPVTGLESIVAPLIDALERAKTNESDSIVDARLDIAKADLLVKQLINLLHGLTDKQVAWALMGVARWSCAIVSADLRLTKAVSPSMQRRIQSIATSIDGATNKGALLTTMSDAISARVSAALRISGQYSSGLVRRLVVNRLVWVVPHNQMDPSVDLPWVAVMLGLPLEANVVQVIHQVAHIAIETSRGRCGTRKERPVDALLSQTLRASVGDPLMNPNVGPALIRALSHLVEAKQLKGRVDDPRFAARFLEPGAIRTVSGAWSDLVAALAEWDVLASTIHGFEPVSRGEQGWCIDGQPLDDAVVWSMRIPRSQPQRPHAVVAVRLVELIEAGGGGEAARSALKNRWESVATEHDVTTWMADHGVAVFSCAASAIRFASRVNRTFIGPEGLLEIADETIALPPGIRPSVGVSFGLVYGGIDGVDTIIDGPALARAIGRCGGSKKSVAAHDPLQVRRVTVGAAGMASHGVACGRTAMLEALNRWGQSIHRYGDNNEVNGFKRDFTTYPVDAWAPYDGGTLLFLGLEQHRGAEVVEVLWVDEHMLRDLHVRDQDLAAGGDGMIEDDSPSIELDDPFDEEATTGPTHTDPFGFEPNAVPIQKPQTGLDHSDWGDIGFGDDGGTER